MNFGLLRKNYGTCTMEKIKVQLFRKLLYDTENSETFKL